MARAMSLVLARGGRGDGTQKGGARSVLAEEVVGILSIEVLLVLETGWVEANLPLCRTGFLVAAREALLGVPLLGGGACAGRAPAGGAAGVVRGVRVRGGLGGGVDVLPIRGAVTSMR